MIGGVELETPHNLNHNEFRENYLAGIQFEKGAHGLLYECLFNNNGCETTCETQVNDDWRGAIFSNFDIISLVPLLQTPLVYNNTFVNNYHALSIYDTDYNFQFINMPIFLNNIVYNPEQGSEKAIFKKNEDRLQLISMNNFYYCNGNVFSNSALKLQSSNDHSAEDPLFIDPESDWRLDDESPCFDSGFFNLFPQVTSESLYQDYGILDIGYHYVDEIIPMGMVENLDADSDTIYWDDPQIGDPVGYVIVWENNYGDFVGLEYLTPVNSYVVSEELLGIGLWFGVSAYNESGAFGYPVFIEM